MRGSLFKRVRRAAEVVFLGVAILLSCLPVFSQGNLGRILGVVTDQTGGVIAGATVTVTDVQRGVSRSLMTDDSGQYSATLIPGAYEVQVDAPGFNKFDRKNITVEVGQEIRVDASLSPGSQTQTVTVTEAVPDITTTNATMGGVIENQTLTELPLSGRNYLHLLDDKPGVQMKPGGGPNSYTATDSETRPTVTWSTAYSAGMSTPAPARFWAEALEQGARSKQTCFPSMAYRKSMSCRIRRAEYGPRPGAYINIGLKSGTNAFHGTAYGFGTRSVARSHECFPYE